MPRRTIGCCPTAAIRGTLHVHPAGPAAGGAPPLARACGAPPPGLDRGFAAVEPDIAAAVKDAAKVFAGLGAEVSEAGLKLDPPPITYWSVIWYANAKALYGHLMDEHIAELTPYTVAQIQRGTKI